MHMHLAQGPPDTRVASKTQNIAHPVDNEAGFGVKLAKPLPLSYYVFSGTFPRFSFAFPNLAKTITFSFSSQPPRIAPSFEIIFSRVLEFRSEVLLAAQKLR